MFVKNLTKEVLTIRKSGNVLKLQPGMNCVDETKWSADFILSVYGSKNITIINRDVEELEEVKPVEETPVEQPEETPVPTDDIKEDVAEEVPVETLVEQPEEAPATTDDVKEEAPVETPVEETPVETPVEDKPAEAKAKRNTRANTSKKANQ